MKWRALGRAARSGAWSLRVLVAVVVAALAAVLCLVPVLARQTSDRKLHDDLASATVMERSVRVEVLPDPYLPRGTLPPALGTDPSEPFSELGGWAGRRLAEHSPGALRPPVAVARTVVPREIVPAPLGESRSAELVVTSAVAPRARWVAGRAPVAGRATMRVEGHKVPLVEVAISQAAARRWHVAAGARWTLVGPDAHDRLPVVVTGIYTPLDARDDLWQWYPELDGVAIIGNSEGGARTLAGVVIPTAEHARLGGDVGQTVDMRYVWTWAIDPDRVRPTTLPGLAEGIVSVIRDQLGRTTQVQSALAGPLAAWRQQVRSLAELDAALVTGLVVLAAAVLLMLAGLHAARRQDAARLLRVRGGSLRQLALLAALDIVPAALLGAALGWAAACVLARERCGAWPALVLAVVAPVLAAVTGVRACLRDTRTAARQGVRRPRLLLAGRAVPAALGLLVTAAGVLTVRQRPMPTPPLATSYTLDEASARHLADTAVRTDPLVQSVPALAALCLAVLVIGVVLALSRWVMSRGGRWRAAPAWLGMVRLARSSAAVALPLVGLVVATALTVLGTSVEHTSRILSELHSWQRTGAQVRLDALQLDPGRVGQIGRTAGVEAVAPVGIRPGTVKVQDRSRSLRVLVADRGALADVRAGTPLALRSGPQPEGTLVVSRDLAELREPGAELRVGSTLVPFDHVVVDPGLDDVDQPPTVLVDPGAGRLRRILGTATDATSVLVRTTPGAEGTVADALRRTQVAGDEVHDVAATRSDAALRHVRDVVLLVATTTMLLAGLVVWALAAVGAASRRALLARTRVLGLPARGRLLVVVLELVTACLTAIVAGVAVGLVLPPLLPRFVDLGAVLGGPAYPAVVPSPWTVTAVVLALLVLVLAVVLLDQRATRRLSLTRHLRGGSR